VAKRRRDARLVAKHGDEAGVLSELGQDALERDLLGEAVRTCAIGHEHLGHSAEAQSLA
jgi:hypothetical protein